MLATSVSASTCDVLCRWQHIDYFDDTESKLPRLLLFENTYLEMHSVKLGQDMDEFESLNLPTASDATWRQCTQAARAVLENRAVEYVKAFNLTKLEEGEDMLNSILPEFELSNETSVLGVERSRYPGRNLDEEATAFDWRAQYPPKMQGSNTFNAGSANWYAFAEDDDEQISSSEFMKWFKMHQQADKEHFEMQINGTVPYGSSRTLSGGHIAPRKLGRIIFDAGIVEFELDSSVPKMVLASDVKGVTFELLVSGRGGSLKIEFTAEGCLYEVLCLTGGLETSNPVRHFMIYATAAVKISNVVDEVLRPLPGSVRDIIVDFVASAFDREIGRIQYDYYRSARIHEKWERIITCAPCHILKARLNIYTNKWLIDEHLRGYVNVAAVYSPDFFANGVWKKHKKDELWGVSPNHKNFMVTASIGFEYRVPGWGYIAGWKNGWNHRLFSFTKHGSGVRWWSHNDKRNRVDNKISKAWDYKHGWGGSDKVDQFYD